MDRQTAREGYSHSDRSLTIESHHAQILILLVFPHLAASQEPHGERGGDGESVQAREEVEGDVSAAGGSFLGARQTDGGAQNSA